MSYLDFMLKIISYLSLKYYIKTKYFKYIAGSQYGVNLGEIEEKNMSGNNGIDALVGEATPSNTRPSIAGGS